MRNDIIARIDKYSKEGSGWVLCKINSFKLYLYRFRLNYGGSNHQELPTGLMLKHCVINIDSNNCFKWAVLAALHHHEVTLSKRATSYTQWENDYNFPSTAMVTAKQIIEFAKQSRLAIYTHLYDKKVLLNAHIAHIEAWLQPVLAYIFC